MLNPQVFLLEKEWSGERTSINKVMMCLTDTLPVPSGVS